MMAWLTFVPIILATLALLFVPGGAVGATLGLRGLWLAAAAAPISVSIVVVTSVVGGLAGVPWGPFPVAVLTVITVVAAILWRRFFGAPDFGWTRSPKKRSAATVLAVGLPAIIIAFILVRGIGDPEYFSQRYDNFFHLNAVQYAIDTANSSPLWLGTMTSPGNLLFYPSGWHAVVSLVVLLTGASVVAATNALIIVTATIVWPLSIVLFVKVVLGSSRMTGVIAGALAAAFPAFPYLPLHYGVLYPLFLGLALAPVALALLFLLLRPGRMRGWPLLSLLLVLVIPGVVVAHPGALMAVLALSVPFVVGRLITLARSSRRRLGKIVWWIALGAYAVIGIAVLRIVRPPGDQIYWTTIESLPQAVGEVVSAAVYQYPTATFVAIFGLVGAYTAVRRPTYTRWMLIGMAFIGGALYVVVAGSPWESLRFWLTAPWYNNAPRLASIWVISALPLAALGGTVMLHWILRRRRASVLRTIASRSGFSFLLVVGLVIAGLTQGAATKQAAADIEYTYQMRDDAPIVSPDEYGLMEELRSLVPPEDVIAGDPWTGTSFAYGLSGRKVLMPHLLMDESEDASTINQSLATEGDSPLVCGALERTGVRFVLDFDAHGDFMANDGQYQGIEGLDQSPFAELVAQDGEAKLFKITSCGFSQ